MVQWRRRRPKDGSKPPRILWRLIRDNGLSLTFAALFLICLAGQVISGAALQAQNHGGKAIGYGAFLTDATFLEGIFVNWQAAILQLGCLMVFGVFLYQKGSTHSRKPRSRRRHRRIRRIGTWLYRNSLALTFIALFLVSFAFHVRFGWSAYNSERALMHQAPIGFGAYVASAKLWFATFQTWEAEFFVIGLYLVLSVFLRAEGSPESKPANSSNATTGEANQ